MSLLRCIGRICLISTVFMVSYTLEAQQFISATKIRVNNKLSHANIISLESYLNRYVGLVANKAKVQDAQNFISNLFFVSKAKCALLSQKKDQHLVCDVDPKYMVREITINNLRASLLESDLKTKLPVQVGQLIDFNPQNIDSLRSLTRTRVETFLRKNGFYGGQVSVTLEQDPNALTVHLVATIEKGEFARVNSVRIEGDSPLRSLVVHYLYERMCLSFNRIFDAISIGSLSCYSSELEREATEGLQERLAQMGYVKASIRVSHNWIDPHDENAPKHCRKKDPKDLVSRCVDLRVNINKGPLVKWTITMKDGRLVRRNAFSRLLGSIFAVDQFSRLTSSDESGEISSDRMIIEQELEKRINFVEAKNLDEQEISISVKQMTEYLASKGYINAKITPSVVQKDPNNILVDFQVYAGEPFSIRSVNVAPSPFSSLYTKDELSELVRVRSFSSAGNISYPQISESLEKVVSRAKEKGYNDAKGQAQITSYGGGDVNVRFFLQGSARETIAKISIINGYEKLNSEVMPTLKNCDHFYKSTCEGSSLVRNSIESDQDKIAAFYQSNDFLYAHVRSELEKTDNGYHLIFYIYDERYGEKNNKALTRQIIKDIIISGHSNTKDSVIKRLFPSMKYGQNLDSISLKKGVSNLRESGRFSRIDYKLMAGQENSEDVYFTLQLVERPSLTFDVGVSISTDHLLSLEAEVEENNLFSSMLTLKTKLGLGLFWGRQSSLTNKLVWPFIWGKPFSFTLHAPMIIYDDKLHQREPFRRLQSRVVAVIDWRASSNLLPYLRYSLVHNKQENFEPGKVPVTSAKEKFLTLDGLIPVITEAPGKIAGVLKPGISFINLDNPFDPRSGLDSNNWVELSGGLLQGDPPFINVGTQNRFFIPMGNCTLALQATFMRAFIVPNKSNFEHLRGFSSMEKPGGDRSVRGYEEGDLGLDTPRLETKAMTGYFSNIANIEFRFPLTETGTIGKLSGALFADQGMLFPCSSWWGCDKELSLEKLIQKRGFGLSLGVGLRYLLPVGPISLDYGISPIHANEQRIHFQFGYSF